MVASRRESGKNVTSDTVPSWPARTRRRCGCGASAHSQTMPSSDAEASIVPSGENATPFTSPSCPTSIVALPVAPSHTPTERSALAGVPPPAGATGAGGRHVAPVGGPQRLPPPAVMPAPHVAGDAALPRVGGQAPRHRPVVAAARVLLEPRQRGGGIAVERGARREENQLVLAPLGLCARLLRQGALLFRIGALGLGPALRHDDAAQAPHAAGEEQEERNAHDGDQRPVSPDPALEPR